MRADARRNRERIVAGALDLFAARGPAVSMEDIAHAAGVAVGTLYRHFPHRNALVAQIAEGALTDLLAVTREVAAGDGTGWQHLDDIARHCAGLPLALVKTLMRELPGTEALERLNAESDASLTAIAARGQRDGSIRADLTPAEVLELFSMATCRAGAKAGDSVSTVILDGLRGAGTTPATRATRATRAASASDEPRR
ncbi:TetR family transcriptional regulator [Streptomyces sp. 3MP-14]|uniref:TetR family transcriptional regulator n=1 Tax=Streptomyces mimosae TaxID=2586635 RepID=A0A5N6A7V6_9ACTN|nr:MULTISPECIES: helix-turn-helix domain-containing protein [Streptomyces]KAB8163800.1 TetR family transcriptional regulator [Streptomyces mimosae]KAB8175243.1 TetR family transcriptional regulator [Streptomyces sp. 3MP-14]